MGTIDPNAPVLIGAGQVTERERAHERSPLELMVSAAELAAAGTARQLLERVESIGVVDCLSWPVSNPAALLADCISASPACTLRTLTGGTGPIELLANACSRIQAGTLDVALIAGAEAINPFRRAMREQRPTGWPEQSPGEQPTRLLGNERPASLPEEMAAGLLAPLHYYPLFEHAVRGQLGHTPQEHQRWLGELWHRFAAVAAENPHAWISDPPEAEQISNPSPQNRMAAHPYTKLLTANIQVDQGAALLLCSARTAAQAGIDPSQWVFVHCTASANDHWHLAEREHLYRSPAIAACAQATLGHCDIDIDDVELLDLYSCFPSAAQIAARELRLDLTADRRAPTVTGGLTFAGGPGSNYVTHSLAQMSDRLRETQGTHGLLTGVGWYMTKHANALLGSEPPARRYVHLDCQADVDLLSRRTLADPSQALSSIESYTVIYDRSGEPQRAIVSCLLEDGRRAFGHSAEADTAIALTEGEPLGRPVALHVNGHFSIEA